MTTSTKDAIERATWTSEAREMLEYTDRNVGLEGGEHLLAVMIEISEKLSEILVELRKTSHVKW